MSEGLGSQITYPLILKVTVTCGRKFHSDHVAAALHRAGTLERVITANPRRAYRRYSFSEDRIVHAPPVYLPGLAAGRIPVLRSLEPSLSWWASRYFDSWASRHLGQPDIVLAWAWSANRTFQTAKARGIRCVLEECGSANSHQEALLADEHQRLGLSPRCSVGTRVIENEREECMMAERILCPSEYVASSYSVYGIPREKCLVIPYASNPALFNVPKVKGRGGKLRILYVGSVGPRKGLIYLLRALEQLPRQSFECTVIGRVEPQFSTVLSPFAHLFTHIPSVPHHDIPNYYSNASVFVLPTLDEGMALVLMEALCSGTPVITTPNSGGESMIKDGINGFMVPIRDANAIAQKLTIMANDPDLLARMSEDARTTAGRWTWDDYAKALLRGLETPS